MSPTRLAAVAACAAAMLAAAAARAQTPLNLDALRRRAALDYSKTPKLVMASFAGYKMAGPLLVSTDHRGTVDGKPLSISISNLAVKLTGSDKWIEAQ